MSAPELPQLPLIEAAEADANIEIKPTWRGWIHAGVTPIALAAGIVLIVLAQGAPAKWAAAVFTLTSLLLFGMSAVYHRFNWSPKTKLTLKRIDHANIFLLIAGTYTPLAVLALPPAQGTLLLALVWGGTVIGIMNSFRDIAAKGETNLTVVAPGIAEALFATALGLFAAIPALIFYNKFSSDISAFSERMANFASEVSVRLSRRLHERRDA